MADEMIASPILSGSIKRAVQTLRDIFSEFRMSIEEIIAEEDKVVARCTMHETYRQNLLGILVVNRSIGSDYITIFRLKDNQIKGFWFKGDGFGMFKQLGLLGVLFVFLKFGKRAKGG